MSYTDATDRFRLLSMQADQLIRHDLATYAGRRLHAMSLAIAEMASDGASPIVIEAAKGLHADLEHRAAAKWRARRGAA